MSVLILIFLFCSRAHHPFLWDQVQCAWTSDQRWRGYCEDSYPACWRHLQSLSGEGAHQGRLRDLWRGLQPAVRGWGPCLVPAHCLLMWTCVFFFLWLLISLSLCLRRRVQGGWEGTLCGDWDPVRRPERDEGGLHRAHEARRQHGGWDTGDTKGHANKYKPVASCIYAHAYSAAYPHT